MLKALKQATSPILSLVILMLVSGLVNTLIPLRMHADGSPEIIVGLATAVFYGGMFLSAFNSERLIARIGHIRAFAAFTAMLGISILLTGLIVNDYAWLVFRTLMGLAIGGLYIVIESWLMVIGDATSRGKILSIYMIGLYGAQAAGQYLLNIADPFSLIPLALAALLTFMAIIPVTMTRATCPMLEQPSALGFWKLYNISPSAIIGAVCAGLILGAAYGMFPVYLQQNGYDLPHVATIMSALIFGGMALQYPIGHLSDKMSRRGVLFLVSATALATGLATIPIAESSYLGMIIMAFLFGGTSFTLYPLTISHMCDYLEADDVTAAAQGMLLAYGIGAIIGPFMASIVMHLLPADGLFLYFCAILAFLTVFFGWRRLLRAKISVDEQEPFVAVPRTTPMSAELDPRSYEEDDPTPT